MAHANSTKAVEAFWNAYRPSVVAGSVASGDVMTERQAPNNAAHLAARFPGRTVTIDEMVAEGVRIKKGQLRVICLEAPYRWLPEIRQVGGANDLLRRAPIRADDDRGLPTRRSRPHLIVPPGTRPRFYLLGRGHRPSASVRPIA